MAASQSQTNVQTDKKPDEPERKANKAFVDVLRGGISLSRMENYTANSMSNK